MFNLVIESNWNYFMQCQVVKCSSHEFMEWIIWKHIEKVKNRKQQNVRILVPATALLSTFKIAHFSLFALLENNRFACNCSSRLKLPLISWCVYSCLLFCPLCFLCLNILNRNDICCSLSMNFDFTGSAHLLTWKKFMYSFPVLVGISIGLDDVWTSWAAADLSIWLGKDCFRLSIEDLTFILLWASYVMWSSNSSILLNVWEHWISLEKVIVQS